MRKRIALLAALLVASGTGAGQDRDTNLQAELLEMGRLDQDVRFRIMAMIQSDPATVSEEEFRALMGEQTTVDEANLVRLEEIVREYGWPSTELVGKEANGAAWVILQHADIAVQRRYLPLLREATKENRALASNLAMLEDEIALVDSGQQIYGTEIKMVDDIVFVAPVVDPEQLDERRAAVGLPPMEDYLKEAEAEIGRPIDRSNLYPN